jgi:hypothetical protein
LRDGAKDGPSIELTIVDNHTKATYTHALLDSGSRETVISAALVHHLVVRGLSRVASEEQRRECELIQFVLPEDTVVSPRDRIHINTITKGGLSRHEVFPFVLQSEEEYLIIWTKDMKRCNLIEYLAATIAAVESDEEESRTSATGQYLLHRTTGDDGPPDGEKPTTKATGSSSAEKRNQAALRPTGASASNAGTIQHPSTSGPVKRLGGIPYQRPQGLTSQEQR